MRPTWKPSRGLRRQDEGEGEGEGEDEDEDEEGRGGEETPRSPLQPAACRFFKFLFRPAVWGKFRLPCKV